MLFQQLQRNSWVEIRQELNVSWTSVKENRSLGPVQMVPAHRNALKTRSRDDAYQLRYMHLDLPVRAQINQMQPCEDKARSQHVLQTLHLDIGCRSTGSCRVRFGFYSWSGCSPQMLDWIRILKIWRPRCFHRTLTLKAQKLQIPSCRNPIKTELGLCI